MSRVISVVYDPRLFLACVETSMNKYRRNSFPSQIAHNSFGTLPPFLHVLNGFWWREPKVLLQGLLKNFIPDIFFYLLLIIDKNKIVRKNVSPTFTNYAPSTRCATTKTKRHRHLTDFINCQLI